MIALLPETRQVLRNLPAHPRAGECVTRDVSYYF